MTGQPRRIGLAVGLVAAVWAYTELIPGHRGYFDLAIYQGAVQHWLREGGELYEYLRPGTPYGFTYPPFAALVLSPLAYLGWPVAVILSVLVSLAATATVVWVLVDPGARRRGWPRWFAVTVAGCAAMVLEPVRNTFTIGQINLVLLALVLADLRWLSRGSGAGGGGRDGHRGSGAGGGGRDRHLGGRYAGVGIGLAAAIKLTPALFLPMLVLFGARRAAAVGAATAAGATLLAAAVAPGESWRFWTGTLWEMGRVGEAAYVSNQSLRGVLARLELDSTGWWVAAVVVVLLAWAIRVRRAAHAGDLPAGFALTGLAACLVSPITWVHHLVWLLPALVVLVDAGLGSGPGQRRPYLLAGAAASCVVLCSSLVWLWRDDPAGLDGFLGGNAYVWLTLGLLLALPIRPGQGVGRGRAGRRAEGGPAPRPLPGSRSSPYPVVAVTSGGPILRDQPR